MRFAMMGTGGVGGYFGARLAAAGHEVAFIARGAQRQAMREHGLRVRSPQGDLHLKDMVVTDQPGDVGPVDVVLFGVKLWDTEAAARAIAPMVGPETVVISLQNGVVKDELLREACGAQAVAGGLCYIASTIAEPGLIVQTGTLQRLVFGEYGGENGSATSPRLERLKQACESAGLEAVLHPQIEKAIWEKFVFLVGLSGATAVTRSAIGAVRTDEAARRLLGALMQETVDVGRAQGIALDPAFAEERLRFCDGLPPDMKASMLVDLEAGRRLELPWLSGDVVRRGQRLGIATPVNQTVHDALALHAAGRNG